MSTDDDFDMMGLDDEEDSTSDTSNSSSEESSSSNESNDSSLIRQVIGFCGGPDLVQIFGETGSGKTEFCTTLAESARDEANKDILFIDTEKNLSDDERMDGIDYIYIPDWDDIYAFISGKSHKLSDDPFGESTTNSKVLEDGYDVVILDSIGLPALMKYDEYSIEDDADQFKIFQMLQFISGKLKRYAQQNDSLVIATNQPGSKLGDDGGEMPFGDKSLFAFKELWRSYKDSSNEVKTTCTIKAHRSRQAGQGKKLFQIEVDDTGSEITRVDSDAEDDEWAM